MHSQPIGIGVRTFAQIIAAESESAPIGNRAHRSQGCVWGSCTISNRTVEMNTAMAAV